VHRRREKRNTQEGNAVGKRVGGAGKQNRVEMYDAYRCCTLPKMRMCARTSNIKITNTERKFTQERKVGREDVRAVEML
jgi:hypothetical protein